MQIPSSSPSAQGVDAAGIAAFTDAVGADRRIEPHGIIVQRHGHRVAEGYWAPHSADRRRLVYSLSKTFTGTALALQLGEGRLGLDDLVSEHLPEMFDDVDERTRRMRVRHIASMASGHDRETILEARAADRDDSVRGFFRIPPDAEPGTLFAYNQPPVLALATVLQRLAGERLVDYLRPRVLEPLGIEDLRWAQERPGRDLGFSGVFTNLDAIARLGQLYLDDGMCDGRRLLPEGWVADASSVQIPNPQREEPDWQQGYGFQVWMSRHGYRGDGAFGQYMVILPEHDAVVAMFSCTEQMQVVLDLMWEHLVPAFGGDRDGDSTAANAAAADAALASRLAGLTLPTAADRTGGRPLEGATPSSCAPRPAGPLTHRTVSAVELRGDRVLLSESDQVLDLPLTGGWATSADGTIATSAALLDDGRIVLDLAFLDTPHRLEIEIDPATSTFDASWPSFPLFGAGLGPQLAKMRAPAS